MTEPTGLLEQLPALRRFRYFKKDDLGLDAFPHVIAKLKIFWGYEDLYAYVDSLLVSDRDRMGFPPSVILELDKLVEAHKLLFPDLKYRPIDVQDNYRSPF